MPTFLSENMTGDSTAKRHCLKDIAQIRILMSELLETEPTIIAAFKAGQRSQTTGVAFLLGYQMAMRCLDPELASDTFAALVVSEKGVRHPKDMVTKLSIDGGQLFITGQKSHVMLFPNHLDQLYVIVKNEQQRLVGVTVPSSSIGLNLDQPVLAPFVQDIPHCSIKIENVAVEPAQVIFEDGHAQANKPFRYWEDMHVAMAYLGWMVTNNEAGDNSILLECANKLAQAFTELPQYYNAAALTLLDDVIGVLDTAANNLDGEALQCWQKDRLLMMMGAKIRAKVSVP